ncbi:MAG: hypothetical protein U9Q82_09195 [Chloroflexota bacterium]|nr:hypothetical protein [Chloroflexota bacterium]
MAAQTPEKKETQDFKCANCSMRAKSEKKTKSLLARFWSGHNNWCPGWKMYQAALEELK